MTGGYVLDGDGRSRACNCIGPQNGQPLCPCMMRGVVEQEGRWVRVQDLGPVKPRIPAPSITTGCICPAGAERTCRGSLCPRKPLTAVAQ